MARVGTKQKKHRAPRPYARAVVAVGRRQDDAVAHAAEGRSRRRAVGVGDDAAEAARRSQRPRLSFHRSRPLRRHGESRRAAGVGRSIRPLLRHAAPAGARRRCARAATCCSTSIGRARNNCAKRRATIWSVSSYCRRAPGAGAPAQTARAGQQGRHQAPDGQGGRRDEPLARIRLRHHQSRHRSTPSPK